MVNILTLNVEYACKTYVIFSIREGLKVWAFLLTQRFFYEKA